jgi:PmbA protein
VERGCRRQRVDDEGVPTASRALIERGMLTSFLYDSRSAFADGLAPPGNGLRPMELRYAGAPAPRVANIEMAPGDASLEELVEGAGRAVLVQDVMLGTFAFSLVNGDFSFVAPAAHAIEAGKVTHALPPTTVAGNLYRAVQDIQAIGKEPKRLLFGSFVPLRIGGVTCAT